MLGEHPLWSRYNALDGQSCKIWLLLIGTAFCVGVCVPLCSYVKEKCDRLCRKKTLTVLLFASLFKFILVMVPVANDKWIDRS